MTTTAMPDLRIPERFMVSVTPDDIAQGRPCNAEWCPLALAVTRWLRARGFRFATVTVLRPYVEIYLNWGTPPLCYWHDADSLVTAVDHYQPVEPRTVTLARMPR